MARRYLAVLKWSVGLALGAVLLVVGHAGIRQLTGNFHEVIPGELYRSAQPTGSDIATYADTYGIKTIVNLRDEERTGWYRQEAAAAAKAGITLIDFPMSSSQVLPVPEAQRLARLMADAPKPLLIHCEHGANRTGLAAAIYVGAVGKFSEAFAEFQLSPYFGHFAIPGIGRYELTRSWDAFEETIGF
ncbi:tyrosine-protein phosphatase [Rhizobium sp. AN80A]|uniref:fused DSP-PTPase phosphatase/NAD kinase-like protein n=1 Tax=Rhizobium sp. AN80A TaxID=3040673 RepID=UPI0024B37F13|nr:tyrosine-protein phosphatase [Rhizobium sp. AN80A]